MPILERRLKTIIKSVSKCLKIVIVRPKIVCERIQQIIFILGFQSGTFSNLAIQGIVAAENYEHSFILLPRKSSE